MARIARAGIPFGKSQWELWQRHGLIDKAHRVPGSNDYALDPAQWRRLGQLVTIYNQLFGRRSPEAVAYFASLWGLSVPVDLVARHLDKSIQAYYTLMRLRLIKQSNGKLDPRMLKEKDARKLANNTAEEMLAATPPIRNLGKRLALRQCILSLSYVIVCVTYDIRAKTSFVNSIRNIAEAVFEGSTASLGSSLLRKHIERERGRLVDPVIGDNALLREIRETAETKPEMLLRACRDAGLLFAASKTGFGYDDSPPPKIDPNAAKGKARETARMIFSLLPVVTAFLLTFILDDPDNKFLSLLREDEGAKFTKLVARLDRMNLRQLQRLESRP
jgi:hypothetical protein